MTVKELITILQEIENQDLPVVDHRESAELDIVEIGEWFVALLPQTKT